MKRKKPKLEVKKPMDHQTAYLVAVHAVEPVAGRELIKLNLAEQKKKEEADDV